MSRIISAGKTPSIKIEAIDGDLSVVGWDGEDILIKTDEDELTLQHNGEPVSFSCTRRSVTSTPASRAAS